MTCYSFSTFAIHFYITFNFNNCTEPMILLTQFHSLSILNKYLMIYLPFCLIIQTSILSNVCPGNWFIPIRSIPKGFKETYSHFQLFYRHPYLPLTIFEGAIVTPFQGRCKFQRVHVPHKKFVVNERNRYFGNKQFNSSFACGNVKREL